MAKNPLLTQLAVDKAKARSGRRYELPDGPGGVPGFALRVSEHGAKTFALRYRVSDRQRRMTIGSAATMSLAEARQRARAALAQVEQGVDPAAARLEERRERERNSVAAVVGKYVEKRLRPRIRRWADVEAMLRRDVVRCWGDQPIASITERDCLDLIEEIEKRGSLVVANRNVKLLRRLFRWAVKSKYIVTDPAVELEQPHEEKPRQRALVDEAEIKQVWQAFTAMGYPFGTLGQLLLLLGQRRGEVAGLKWSDLDLDQAVWRLASTKTATLHQLPLPQAAVDLLRVVPRFDGDDRLFPSSRARSAHAVSGFSKALAKAHRLSGIADFTWHDLRRSARTHMARLGVPQHIGERILNHSNGGESAISRVYNTYRYEREMREALELWACDLERIVSGGPEAKVLPLRAGAA
jgi:integrase